MQFFAQTKAFRCSGATSEPRDSWFYRMLAPTISLKQDGEKLTGHYTGQLGEADLTGTVKGQAITFTFTVNVQGYEIVNTYTGTVEDKDSLKGTTRLGELGDGTFTAKRMPSPPGIGGETSRGTRRVGWY